MKLPSPSRSALALLLSVGVIAIAPAFEPTAAAQPATATKPPSGGTTWSVTLAGGALAPLATMRDSYQDGLLAGLRVGLRTRIGFGVQVAADYSPLPRQPVDGESFDTAYGTVALLPSWTFGRGVLRISLAAGGGAALEREVHTDAADMETTSQDVQPAAVGQLGIELHVSPAGGVVLLGGGTKTFGADEAERYQYAWAMGGLSLEF